jgi:hypothetical protein
MKKSYSTSFTLTQEAKRLLRLLAEKSGIGLTARLEVLIREQAKRERVR